MEAWRAVPGYEGLYEVSDLGRMRSLDRIVGQAARPVRKRGKLLSPGINSAGYRTAKLSREGHITSFGVHSLVMAAFQGPRPPGMQVLHGPGGPLDNRLENLRYGTPSQNAFDTVRDGTNWWRDMESCLRGHRLAPPNLMPSSPHRACLACNRAHGTVRHAARRGVTLDLEIEADRHYGAIMAS